MLSGKVNISPIASLPLQCCPYTYAQKHASRAVEDHDKTTYYLILPCHSDSPVPRATTAKSAFLQALITDDESYEL